MCLIIQQLLCIVNKYYNGLVKGQVIDRTKCKRTYLNWSLYKAQVTMHRGLYISSKQMTEFGWSGSHKHEQFSRLFASN
jgi:hypothetical protein